jgi:amidohydrolase
MLDQAKKIQPQVVEWRRDFHMHPELGFKEIRTSAKVSEILESIGCRVKTNVGKTGVVGELGEGKPVVAIRADMDALPITETNDVPYKSQNEGLMHACGHDAHTAMLLGVATLFSETEFPGTVRFLFQPSEETEDEEGISGAPRMVEDGAMEDVDYVIALHVDADTECGGIDVAKGNTAAGVDTFYGKVLGTGGHGSTPHLVVDPIHISGHVILALNGIVSRRLDPVYPAVVSIGAVNGGTIDNVIPNEVNFLGTIRYVDPPVQQRLHEEIERAFSIAKTMGGDYELNIKVGYPPIVNHPEVSERIRQIAHQLVGVEKTRELEPSMGAEDFGYFMQEAPGAMFMLGCKIENDVRRHHDPQFDINEDCFPVGVAMLTETALWYLRNN